MQGLPPGESMQGPPPGVELGPPHGEGPPEASRFAEARYFLRYLRPVKWLIALGIGLSLLGTISGLPFTYIPKVLGETLQMTSYPFGFGQGEYIVAYLVFALLASMAGFLISLWGGYCGAKIGEHLLRAIRSDLFGKLEKLSMLSVFSRGAGQFVQRIARDVYHIRDLFNETLTGMISEILRASVYFVAMLTLRPLLTVVLVASFCVVIPFVRWINRRVETLAGRTQVLGEEILAQLVEAISGFRDILATGRFDRFAHRFDDSTADAARVGVRTQMWAQLGGIVPGAVIGALIVVPYFMIADELTPENLGAMITYVMMLSQVLPVGASLTRATSELAIATPSLREVRRILQADDRPPGMPAPPAPEEARPLEGPIRSIRFENVSLRLGGEPIVEDISFEISGGKLTAVVGQSGAGKTTIFHLLLRLLEPTSGTIWINDRPLSTLDEIQLRKLLGFIPQNPFIFNRSLRENLTIAVEDDHPPERIARAVELAQLNELVESRRYEGGLDASAGYMGARLSGGERQRIALGRLLLQDPQVIVCDEYTANIDVRTARLIHEAMRSQFADRTRVVITHELYTIRGADQIVVLDRGRVMQTGTHEALLERPGLYRALWEVQKLE